MRPVVNLMLLAVFVAPAISAGAHEVDHFDLPDGKQFEDIGPHWDTMYYRAVRDAVKATNRKVARTKKYNIVPGLRHARLAQLQSSSGIVTAVRGNLPTALMAIENLEFDMHVLDRPAADSPTIRGHFASVTSGTYSDGPLTLDPRYLNRLTIMRASLVKVHGTHMGTDSSAILLAWATFTTPRLRRSSCRQIPRRSDRSRPHGVEVRTH